MTRALIVDNYDSFTHNLAQLLHGLVDEVRVVRNDAITLGEIESGGFDHVLLSPGPGTPEKPRDFGVGTELVAAAKAGTFTLPVLGVCLGHQGIGHGFGGRVVRSAQVMHGKTSPVHHTGSALFTDITSPFQAMRYHSLQLEAESLPACFEVLAATEDGIIMAMRHRELPLFGMQFHPESIGTPDGRRLLANFLQATSRTSS